MEIFEVASAGLINPDFTERLALYKHVAGLRDLAQTGSSEVFSYVE